MSSSSVTIDYAQDDVMGRLAEEFLSRLAAGEKPTAEEYAADHSELAEVILRVFPALEIMGETSPSSGIEPEGASRGVLGDYQIVQEVGRGGMGVVYEAQQISLDRRVALKVLPFAAMLDERQIKRFRNEARAAAQLKHPSIVQVFGVGCERSVHYYAMEFVEGQTLEQVVRSIRELDSLRGSRPISGSHHSSSSDEAGDVRSAPVTDSSSSLATQRSTRTVEYFRSVARIGMQVAEALDHAHQEGVIHRDIKPSNLMIDSAGKPWITDFGLARIETDPGMTVSGDMLGTLRYMSPEQTLANRVVVDHRTDIYSLGVTLYELLTLSPAFPQEDKHELLRHIAFEDPPRPRNLNRRVPKELETIVMTAIRKRPDDRFYQTAQELADDIRRYLGDKPVLAKQPGLIECARKWAWRRRAILSFVALALALTSVSGLIGVNYSRLQLIAANERLRIQNEKLESLRKEERRRGMEAQLLDIWESDYRHGRHLIRRGLLDVAAPILDDSFERSMKLREKLFGNPVATRMEILHEGAVQKSDHPRFSGARFDGKSSYAVVPGLYFFGRKPLTIEVIATRSSFEGKAIAAEMNLLSWTDGGGASICTQNIDRWAFWMKVGVGANGYQKAMARSIAPLRVRQHIAGVWDGESIRLYIDGVKQDTLPAKRENVEYFASGLPLHIGADPQKGYVTSEHFAGMIEAVRVSFETVYTGNFDPPKRLENLDSTVVNLDFRFDEGHFAYDRSGNSHHAILVNVERVPLRN